MTAPSNYPALTPDAPQGQARPPGGIRPGGAAALAIGMLLLGLALGGVGGYVIGHQNSTGSAAATQPAATSPSPSPSAPEQSASAEAGADATTLGKPSADTTSQLAQVDAPAGANEWAGITVGQDNAPVTVHVFLDYMCPYCDQFEKTNGESLKAAVAAGTVRLDYHPISILDRFAQGTKYSTRAANAAATVADGAPDKFLDFSLALFDNQPAENTTGLTDDQIAQIAKDAGVPDDVISRFTAGQYTAWVGLATQAAQDEGVQGTPTVAVNDTFFEGDWTNPSNLTSAIDAAK